MRSWIIVLPIALLGWGGAPQAQERVEGAGNRQERLERRNDLTRGTARRPSGTAERLDQLLRLREQRDRRSRQLQRPAQEAQPANDGSRRNGVVRTR